MTKLSFYEDSKNQELYASVGGDWDKSQFIHPDDRSAMEAFQRIPGADTLIRMISSGVAERSLLGMCYAQNIRINERQMPEIYALLKPVAEKLNLADKTPTMFIENNPTPNAYTYGVNDVALVLTSGLIHDMSLEEVQAVIGHECGHIVCEHSLYSTASALLQQVGGFILPGIVMEPLKLALAYWSRMAEFSADRVSPLVVPQDQYERALLRLSGIPKYLTDTINIDEYLLQMAEYDRRFERMIDKTIMNLSVAYQSHPFIVNRVRELRKWIASPNYQRLVRRMNH